MCLNPITIPNPYYGFSSKTPLKDPRLVSNKPTIEVPCRHCSECFSLYRNHFIQRCTFESLTSHVFMVTLTYDNKHLPLATFSDGEAESSLPFSDYTHFQNLVKRLRNNGIIGNRQFRYFVATEYGDKRHRPHFHALFFVARLNTDTPDDVNELCTFMYDTIRRYWSVNVGSKRAPVYEPLYTHAEKLMADGSRRSNYDCHLVLPLTKGPNGKLVPNTDLNEYLSSSVDIAPTARYVSSYIQKCDDFIQKRIASLSRLTVRLSDGDYIPHEHFARFTSLFSTSRIASKGLGFGFSPETGKKIFVRSSNYASLDALYKDELVSELYSEYLNLDPSTEHRLIHLLSVLPTLKDVDHFSYSFDGVPFHEVVTLLLAFSSSFRLYYSGRYPDAVLPPKMRPKTVLTSVVDSPTSIYCPSILSVSTPTTQAISKYLDDCCSGAYPTLRAPLPGGFVSSISPFYRRFLSNDQVLRFFDRRGYADFDSYLDSIPKVDRSRVSSSEVLYNNFLIKSSLNSADDHLPSSYVNSISLDNLSPIVYIDPRVSKMYLHKVSIYNQSFY